MYVCVSLHACQNIPVDCLLIDDVIKAHRSQRPVVSWNEYVTLASSCSIEEEEQLVQTTLMLHDIGTHTYIDKHKHRHTHTDTDNSQTETRRHRRRDTCSRAHADATLLSTAQQRHSPLPSGSLIWFNDAVLRDMVILDPQWLTAVMKAMMKARDLVKDGVRDLTLH